MGEEMIPRIVVPDADDASLLVAALIGFAHDAIDSVVHTANLIQMTENVKRALDLVEIINDQVLRSMLTKRFGDTLTASEIEKALSRMRRNLGAVNTEIRDAINTLKSKAADSEVSDSDLAAELDNWLRNLGNSPDA